MNVVIPLLGVAILAALLWRWWKARPGPITERPNVATTAPEEATSPAPAEPKPLPLPALQPLLRRMYAVTMETPSLATEPPPTEGMHARVMAEAAAVLDKLDVQPKYMPRRPQLLPQLMRAVNDPDTTSREIAAIIAQDPALAASLLRIANSALYRPHDGRPLDSIERGVAQIGTDGVRQVVVAALMQPVLSLEGSLFKRLPTAIWDYALRTAAAAAHYARRRGSEDDALSAQLLGLLQGLGAVVVMRILGETYARYPGLTPSLPVAAALLERYTTATAHVITAGWELPDALAQGLAEQQPERDGALPTTTLGAALRYGRLVAVLTVLVRNGDESEDNALALMHTLEPDVEANAQLWERMTSHPASE